MTTDWEYLEQARAGSENAWAQLMQRHLARLTSLALLIVRDAESAKDLAQEAFVRLFQSKLSHQQGTVGGWLSTITYRLALKQSQRESKVSSIDNVEPASTDPSALNQILIGERDRALAQALRSLDPSHRQIIALRFYGGHSYEEIAALTNVPIGTVKSRIFYAVKNCREILKQRGLLDDTSL